MPIIYSFSVLIICIIRKYISALVTLFKLPKNSVGHHDLIKDDATHLGKGQCMMLSVKCTLLVSYFVLKLVNTEQLHHLLYNHCTMVSNSIPLLVESQHYCYCNQNGTLRWIKGYQYFTGARVWTEIDMYFVT